LVLRRTETGPLQTIANTNEFVLNTHKHALTPVLGSEVEVAGISDLAIGGRKFSGNAQRRTGDWILYHGTFLIGFDIQLIDQLLPFPPKQPEYRGGRSHREFLTNLKISSFLMKDAIRNAWHAEGVVQLELQEEIDRLVATRYARKEWVDRL
jgi:lipoate-protein ligase A